MTLQNKNELLYDEALEAIQRLFSDTSVSIAVAKENLEKLKEEIEMMLEGLENS